MKFCNQDPCMCEKEELIDADFQKAIDDAAIAYVSLRTTKHHKDCRDLKCNFECNGHELSESERLAPGIEWAIKYLCDDKRKYIQYNGIFPNNKMWADHIKKEAICQGIKLKGHE